MKKIMVQWLEIICILAFSGLCIAGAEQLSENPQDEGVAFATFNKATNVARIGPEGRGLNRTIIVTNTKTKNSSKHRKLYRRCVKRNDITWNYRYCCILEEGLIKCIILV